MVDPNFGIGRRKFRPAAKLWPLFMPGAWCANKKNPSYDIYTGQCCAYSVTWKILLGG
jgi:hypothetical protein